MKSIVFGGSGFVGSHVADALTEAGHSVVIFDLKVSPYLRPEQEMLVGDILDRDLVIEVVRGCDVVYNFAGIADLDDATTRPLDTIRLNIEGNANLLEASRQANVGRFIYASTIYVYSDKGGFYRCSKQAAELYIEEYKRRSDLDFTILRYGTLYGPRADSRNSIYRYLYQGITERRIGCDGTGEELREYIHIFDAARLSVDMLADKFRNSYVTITGQHPLKFKHLLAMIKEIIGGDMTIQFEPDENNAHYDLTPYSYAPKIGYKLTSNYYVDMGQGLVGCLEEIYRKNESLSNYKIISLNVKGR